MCLVVSKLDPKGSVMIPLQCRSQVQAAGLEAAGVGRWEVGRVSGETQADFTPDFIGSSCMSGF